MKSLPAFSSLVSRIQKQPQVWSAFLEHPTPELALPAGCVESGAADQAEADALQNQPELQQLQQSVKLSVREALLLKVVRPDRLLIVLAKLVQLICGSNFLSVPEMLIDDLHFIVTRKLKSTVHVILVSSPGFDTSSRVLSVAAKQSKHIASIAMGSEEGYEAADKAITAAAKQGSWVLLKNVHLSFRWLQDLEKKLFKMHLHDDFRIFLSMEFNPKVKTPCVLFSIYKHYTYNIYILQLLSSLLSTIKYYYPYLSLFTFSLSLFSLFLLFLYSLSLLYSPYSLYSLFSFSALFLSGSCQSPPRFLHYRLRTSSWSQGLPAALLRADHLS